MSRIGPLFRMMRHVRPEQVLWRLWYRARLRFFGTERYARSLYPDDPAAPIAAPARPRGAPTDRILVLGAEAAAPIDWHPADRTPLWRFTLHYFEWLSDFADADLARGFVADWLAHHAIPDAEAWHPYPLSLRLYAWLAHADFLLVGANDSFRRTFLASLHAQARHLARVIERDVGGNHIVKNLKALVAAGICLPGHDPAPALRLLERALGRQILPDGAHYERSPAYHRQVLDDLSDLVRLLPDPPAWLEAAEARMARADSFYRHGDGMLALFNDGGQGPPEAVASAPDALPDAGYFRLAAGDLLVLVDAGRCCPDDLPAHAHADTLSFEFSAGPQRLVVNCGTYAYQDPVWRGRLRGTACHSTVTVDDRDSAEIFGTFRLGRRPRHIPVARNGNRIEASHDGYRHLGVTHERRLELGPDLLSGRDRLHGSGLSGRRATARFHLHPALTPRLEDGEIRLVAPGGTAWAFRAEGANAGLAPSVYCPDFNVMLATQAIVCEAHAVSDSLILTWSFARIR